MTRDKLIRIFGWCSLHQGKPASFHSVKLDTPLQPRRATMPPSPLLDSPLGKQFKSAIDIVPPLPHL